MEILREKSLIQKKIIEKFGHNICKKMFKKQAKIEEKNWLKFEKSSKFKV